MNPREERLQRSLAEFYAMLDNMRFTGASQVVEIQHLKVLVGKYPEQARRFLADQDERGRPE
ncbi:hypothetical protein [Actinoallomurus rhizosphaericola]|uniref:hypothetical protein n=1 Tax=Actinoallomurus rhizosphaericola TaxID=2952536 RepID=UPI00209366A5|nr:hypothetical protein [Actinoallomurus rhizosphaericola]MCO5995772.1 hypothetical protein [Actinoallomurus rhizosphaericola]